MKAFRLSSLALLTLAGSLQAQSVVGYSAANAQAQRRIEADAVSRPSADSAAAYSRVLSREAHVAGTPAQAKTRDFVIGKMKEWGLETETREYSVWLPHATLAKVSRLTPTPRELDLREPVIPLDQTS